MSKDSEELKRFFWEATPITSTTIRTITKMENHTRADWLWHMHEYEGSPDVFPPDVVGCDIGDPHIHDAIVAKMHGA